MTELTRVAREMQKALIEGKTRVNAIDFNKVRSTMDLYELQSEYDKPEHLRLYIAAIDKALSQRTRFVFSAPPQHGKTTTTLMALIAQCIVRPGRQHMYITYNGKRTSEVRKDFVVMLKRLGIGHRSVNDTVTVWLGTNGQHKSLIRFTSIDGSITGYTVSGIAIIDDPIKSAEEARSQAARDNMMRFFNQSLLTREFDDLSIIVMMTRWAHDDLSGELIKDGWPHLNLKALCDDPVTDPLGRKLDEPLWPARRPYERLNEIREKDPRSFYAMYQGDPTPDKQRLFSEPKTYARTPVGPTTVCYGLDCAYAAKKRSDWSVLVRLLVDARGLVYLDKVIRKQCDITEFAADVKRAQDERMGPIVWKTGGQEQYAPAQLLRDRGVQRLQCVTAKGSKRARAQDVADAWNEGRILVPEKQSQAIASAVDEIVNFTGDERVHDDVVDALGSAFHIVKQHGRGGIGAGSFSRNPFAGGGEDECKAAANATNKQSWAWDRLY